MGKGEFCDRYLSFSRARWEKKGLGYFVTAAILLGSVQSDVFYKGTLVARQ